MTTIPTHMTEQLRNELEQLLTETDQFVANADNANTSEEAKTWIRRAHETQRETRLNNAKDFITQKEDDLIANLANGTDVNPEHIDPTISPVITQHDKDLWKYASLTWSVPVSEGYGRRTKFLVRDRQNGKLIAIFALGDPVIALGPRDDTIGWNKEQRHNRLYNVFDAFVLGAIDPYRQLLAGKLVALCALANETRTFLTNKYSGTTTVLREEQKNPTPVLITTSSALGKSSIYNRLTYYERKAFQPIGYTRGFGHFHIPEDIFRQLALLIRAEGSNVQGAYGRGADGGGANYRFRVIRTAFKELGLPANALQHGVKRQIFLAPVAHNWKEFLCGETDTIDPINMPAGEIAEYYKLRWAIPRSQRRPEFKSWKRDDLRLSRLINAPIQYSFAQAFAEAEHIDIATPPAPGDITSTATPLDDTTTQLDVTYRNIECQLVDKTSRNGTRTITATHINSDDSNLNLLVGQHKIKIEPSPVHPNLSLVNLKFAVHDSINTIAIRKLDPTRIEELLGQPLEELLPRAHSIITGTRKELLKDTTRTRHQLCALFPNNDPTTPGRIWAVTRVATLLNTIEQ